MRIKNLLKEIEFHDFIAFDLETTGLDSKRNEIIEISALRFVDGELDDEFTALVKPTQKIPEKITEITGINDSMVANAPHISEVLDDFISFMDGSIVVAHNAEFDLEFINQNISKYSKEINIKSVCDTLLLSRSFLFSLEKFNLEFLSNYFNLSHDAHRARADAFNTGIILIKLIEQMCSFPIEIFQKINKICNNQTVYNKLLYINILNFLKSNQTNKIKPIKEFNVRNNVLNNKNSPNNDFSDDIDSWFSNEGKVSKSWPNYQKRDIQVKLSSDIHSNFSDNSILIAEAEAGLGKSLSYLIAGLKYAKENNKKLIISTYTKALQEQLFYKDIPVLINYLNLNLKAIILKGKNNYLSKLKFNEIIDNDYINIKDKEINECITLIVWSHFTVTGDIEECNGIYRERIVRLWNQLTYSEMNDLDFYKSQYGNFHQNDYYNKIMKEANDSDIIIINHSLFCNDISSDSPSLPLNSLLIIDEGHNLINAVKNQLTLNFSDSYLLSIFYSLKNSLDTIEAHNYSRFDNRDEIVTSLDDLIKEVSETFKLFKFNFEEIYSNLEFNSYDLVLSQEEYNLNGLDLNNIYFKIDKLIDYVDLFLESCSSNKNSSFNKTINPIELIRSDLNENKIIMKNFIDNSGRYIKWISLYKSGLNNHMRIYVSDSDIKSFMLNKIYKLYPSFTMCSATFTINESFNFLFQNLGVDGNLFKTNIYKSPFYYEDQAKFYIYNKKIDINSGNYINDISNQISFLYKSLYKKTLILCTSYKQVKSITNNLLNNSDINNEDIFTQTSRFSKKRILDNYKQSKGGILIGTSTFWEGIDLSGKLLEILFIVRIPFGNPSNPYNRHLSNIIEGNGGNPFYDLELPSAILKLKQGIGRLIRSDKDTGVCIITDPRLSKSRYGNFIIDEMPVQPHFYDNINEITNEIDNFLG